MRINKSWVSLSNIVVSRDEREDSITRWGTCIGRRARHTGEFLLGIRHPGQTTVSVDEINREKFGNRADAIDEPEPDFGELPLRVPLKHLWEIKLSNVLPGAITFYLYVKTPSKRVSFFFISSEGTCLRWKRKNRLLSAESAL